jgi:hypothetical protein
VGRVGLASDSARTWAARIVPPGPLRASSVAAYSARTTLERGVQRAVDDAHAAAATPRMTWSAKVAPTASSSIGSPSRTLRQNTFSVSQSDEKNATNSGTSAHISGWTWRERPVAAMTAT